MLIPSMILIIACSVSISLSHSFLRIITLLMLFFSVGANIASLLTQQYLIGTSGGYGPSYVQRLEASNQIVKEAGGNRYTIKGEGKGSEFPSFTMNYMYLTAWLGKPMSERAEETFTISETENDVTVRKESK